ncbi:MAG: hypothetical protein LN413_05500 [Candidatus Thermoplasmatota archaeon]|nr:hypothetical protein [Candidatus Thermoplasmatota archaeon]
MEEQVTEAPPKPPAAPPARPPAPPSAGPGRDEALTTRLVGRGGLVAAVVMIGVLLLAAAVLLRVPSFVEPALFPSPGAHQDFVRILIGASALLVDVAMFLLLILALLVGVLRTDLSDSTRKGFMAFALILFFFWFVTVLFQSRAIPFFP